MKRVSSTFLWMLFYACFARADIFPIQPTSPSHVSSPTADKMGRIPAIVSWKNVPEASYYYLLLSKYKDFEEGKLFRTVKPRQFLMIYPDIEYYWTVQAFDEKGGRLPFESFAPHTVIGRYEGLRPVANDLVRSDEPVERDLASTEQPPDKMEETGMTSSYDYGGVKNSESDEETSPQKPAKQEMLVRVIETYPAWLKRNKFWVSTEAGLFDFSQKHSALSDVSANGLMFPSFGLNYQSRNFWNHLAARLYFRNTVGSFETKSSVTLIDNDFQFLQYGAVGMWTVNPGKRLEWAPYAGIERQTNPYFLQISPTSITVKDMLNTNAVLGMRLNYSPNSRWKHYLDAGYYHLLDTTADDLSSSTVTGKMYEFQVGATRQFKKNGFFAGANLRAALRDFNEDVVTQTSQASNGGRDTKYYAFEVNAGIVF